MGCVIYLARDRHIEAQELLPWYASDRLDADDRASVDEHLQGCATCRADLEIERRLAPAVAALPVGVDQGWTAMRRRIDRTPRRRLHSAAGQAMRTLRRPGVAGGLIAAQLAVVLLFAGVMTRSPATDYRALGAATPPPAGNVIVVFTPETREADLRRLLRANRARLVDGPTEANAYVLRTDANGRDAVVAKLRAETGVVLAEPIDPVMTK